MTKFAVENANKMLAKKKLETSSIRGDAMAQEKRMEIKTTRMKTYWYTNMAEDVDTASIRWWVNHCGFKITFLFCSMEFISLNLSQKKSSL